MDGIVGICDDHTYVPLGDIEQPPSGLQIAATEGRAVLSLEVQSSSSRIATPTLCFSMFLSICLLFFLSFPFPFSIHLLNHLSNHFYSSCRLQSVSLTANEPDHSIMVPSNL